MMTSLLLLLLQDSPSDIPRLRKAGRHEDAQVIVKREMAEIQKLVYHRFNSSPIRPPEPRPRIRELLEVHRDLEEADRRTLLDYLRVLPRERWAESEPRVVELASDLIDCPAALQLAATYGFRPLLPRIRPLLKNPERRYRAMATLAELGDKESIEPIAEFLADDDWQSRRYAAEALGTLQATAAVDRLLRLLGDKGMETNYVDASIEALGRIGDPRALEPLRAFLAHESEYMRKTAVRALANLGDPGLRERVVELLRGKPRREDYLETLFEAATRLNIREAGPEILKIFDERCVPDSEKCPILSSLALRALGELRVSESVPSLLRCLEGCRQASDVSGMRNDICFSAGDVLLSLARKEDLPALQKLSVAFAKRVGDGGWNGRIDHAYHSYQKILCALAILGAPDKATFTWIHRCAPTTAWYSAELLLAFDAELFRKLDTPRDIQLTGPAKEVVAALSRELGLTIRVEAELPETLRLEARTRWTALRNLCYSFGVAVVREGDELKIVPLRKALEQSEKHR
jgi:HEAT repeat protein